MESKQPIVASSDEEEDWLFAWLNNVLVETQVFAGITLVVVMYAVYSGRIDGGWLFLFLLILFAAHSGRRHLRVLANGEKGK